MLAAGSDSGRSLYKAAARGEHDRVARLLESGADVGYTTGDGHTPLMAASSNGHPSIIRLLLGARANRELRDAGGMSAADHAVDDATRAALRDGLPPASPTSSARSAADTGLGTPNDAPSSISRAASSVSGSVASSHAEETARNHEHAARLRQAAMFAELSAAEAVLAEPDVDVNFIDKHGRTALMYAATYGDKPGQVEVVRALLRAGADPALKNVRGQSALFLCSGEEVERVLTEHMQQQEGQQERQERQVAANPPSVSGSEIAPTSDSASVRSGPSSSVFSGAGGPESVPLARRPSTSSTVSEKSTSNPRIAKMIRREDIGGLKAALDSGIDPNIRLIAQRTPLLLAAAFNVREAVTELLKRGALPELEDKDRLNAVELAVRTSAPTEMVEDMVRNCLRRGVRVRGAPDIVVQKVEAELQEEEANGAAGSGKHSPPVSVESPPPQANMLISPVTDGSAAGGERASTAEARPATDRPAAEDPAVVAERPVAEEPTPIAERPAVEQPTSVAERPAAEQPTPVAERPAAEEPTPVAERPAAEEPTPVAERPAAEDPTDVTGRPAADGPPPATESQPAGAVRAPEPTHQAGDLTKPPPPAPPAIRKKPSDSSGKIRLGRVVRRCTVEELREKITSGELDVNATSQGRTLLIHAAAFNEPDKVEALVELGADVDVRDDDGETAEDHAALYPRVLELLRRNRGARPKEGNSNVDAANASDDAGAAGAAGAAGGAPPATPNDAGTATAAGSRPASTPGTPSSTTVANPGGAAASPVADSAATLAHADSDKLNGPSASAAVVAGRDAEGRDADGAGAEGSPARTSPSAAPSEPVDRTGVDARQGDERGSREGGSEEEEMRSRPAQTGSPRPASTEPTHASAPDGEPRREPASRGAPLLSTTSASHDATGAAVVSEHSTARTNGLHQPVAGDGRDAESSSGFTDVSAHPVGNGHAVDARRGRAASPAGAAPEPPPERQQLHRVQPQRSPQQATPSTAFHPGTPPQTPVTMYQLASPSPGYAPGASTPHGSVAASPSVARSGATSIAEVPVGETRCRVLTFTGALGIAAREIAARHCSRPKHKHVAGVLSPEDEPPRLVYQIGNAVQLSQIVSSTDFSAAARLRVIHQTAMAVFFLQYHGHGHGSLSADDVYVERHADGGVHVLLTGYEAHSVRSVAPPTDDTEALAFIMATLVFHDAKLAFHYYPLLVQGSGDSTAAFVGHGMRNGFSIEQLGWLAVVLRGQGVGPARWPLRDTVRELKFLLTAAVEQAEGGGGAGGASSAAASRLGSTACGLCGIAFNDGLSGVVATDGKLYDFSCIQLYLQHHGGCCPPPSLAPCPLSLLRPGT